MTDRDDDQGHVSVTRLFTKLQSGDEQAMNALWEFYFPKLVSLARERFSKGLHVAYGADDAAQSALYLLYRGASDGRLDEVKSRDDLWRLLATSMRRRVIDQVRRRKRQKRGDGNIVLSLDDDVFSDEWGPEFLAICDESLAGLMSKLRDDTFRQIAQMRMEGYSNAEIAKHLQVSERTIERKLNLIRLDWL